MNALVTTLDQRYSDPAAEAVSWEVTQRLLEAAEIAWLTTVRADGRPHVTPVVSAWYGRRAVLHHWCRTSKST